MDKIFSNSEKKLTTFEVKNVSFISLPKTDIEVTVWKLTKEQLQNFIANIKHLSCYFD